MEAYPRVLRPSWPKLTRHSLRGPCARRRRPPLAATLGQTLHLALSSPLRGAPPTAPATGFRPCPSSASQPIIVPLQVTPSVPLAPVAPAPRSPALVPSNWSLGLPVFYQCSNHRLPPGPHLPGPRTRRDHPRDPEPLPTALPLPLSDWLQVLPVCFMLTNPCRLQR